VTLRVIVEADGGSRGNPGPAGFGAVVLDAGSGEVLAERLGGLGMTTNNVAEYQGLVAGLRAAAELGAHTVEVRMDSKLVVEQMSGRWKIRHAQLQPLAQQARETAASFRQVTYHWVPREQNRRADKLANEAMDAQARGGTPTLAEHTAPTPKREPERSADEPAQATLPEIPEDNAAEAAQTAGPASWSGATGTPTRLLLLRHAQTEHSAQRRYSGRGDVPLTDVGMRQAAAAARRLASLDVATIVSSPLRRARQTADEVSAATDAEIVLEDGFTEVDFGAWEGLTFAEAAARDPDVHRRWLSDPSVPPPGGESFAEVHRRVRRATDELIAKHGGATLVVVSHVTPIKTLLRMALDAGPSVLYRLHLDLISLSVIEFYPDGHASVRLVNDTCHLQ
jgi:ribonuclease H / adenosylcobalamin/alpha-ribazole phosphatase